MLPSLMGSQEKTPVLLHGSVGWLKHARGRQALLPNPAFLPQKRSIHWGMWTGEAEASFPSLVQSHPLTLKGYSAFLPTFSRLEGSSTSKAQAAIENVWQDRPNEDTARTNHAMPEVA